MKCDYNSCTIKVCIPPYTSSEKKVIKYVVACFRTLNINIRTVEMLNIGILDNEHGKMS